MMRRIHVSLILTGITLLLLTAVTPLQADTGGTAEGLWKYTPYTKSERLDDCNKILTTFEDGVWSGTFDGLSTEDGKVIVHCSGWWSFFAIVTFEEVTVEGKSGGLFMSVRGSRPDATSDWCGFWVIVDGTGELEDLSGHGSWWGPGAPAEGVQGDIHYEGKVKWSAKPESQIEFGTCEAKSDHTEHGDN
jgi:hypothetical protein